MTMFPRILVINGTRPRIALLASLLLASGPQVLDAQDATEIFGELIHGADSVAVGVHPFDMATGQFFDVEVNSADFDTVLELESPSGQMHRNDDSELGTDSRISASGEIAGTWVARVTAFDRSDGTYRLVVRRGELARVLSPLTGRLEERDSVTSKGRRFEGHDVDIDGPYRLVVEMSAVGFDPVVVAVTPTGSRLVGEREAFGNEFARIDVPVTQPGTWRLYATSYPDTDAFGAYTIRLFVIPIGNGLTVVTGALEGDDPTDFTGEHYDIHDILGYADSTTVVELHSEAFDSYLAAQSPRGEWCRDDDGGGETDARLELPPMAGTWRLITTSLLEGETGPYRILVSRRPAPTTFPIAVQPEIPTSGTSSICSSRQ